VIGVLSGLLFICVVLRRLGEWPWEEPSSLNVTVLHGQQDGRLHHFGQGDVVPLFSEGMRSGCLKVKVLGCFSA